MRHLFAVVLSSALVAACTAPAQPPAAGSGDAAFRALAAEIIDDTLQRSPSFATYLGIHKYDERLESFRPADISANVASARAFRQRLDSIDPALLSDVARLDRELLQHEMDNRVLQLDVVRSWATDADSYTTAATNAVFGIMMRNFAPASDRLRSVIAREKLIPALLAQARGNLDNPPEVFTRVAISQNDGIQSFFRNDLPLPFAEVTDKPLLAEFRKTNEAVLTALADYKRWLETEILPRSKGSYALGATTYTALLSASNMIDTPLDQLLQIAEANRAANEEAFVAAAKLIDPAKGPADVLASFASKHPAPAALLSTTQNELDSLRQFITAKGIATIPPSEPARVKETPPFMRATTKAAMDTPGPWETGATEAYFYATLPDPRWKASEQEAFMRQWYYPAIVNVAVHEVYPGHYLQFLYARNYPSDVRKVFGASSNSEGWAHYTEQMMLDEGFHADEPAYRLAQLQDALLRDVRFIVGIKMHTQGMTLDEATNLFVTQAHQPAPVARAEATRGAGDPLYGYYTMGKLAILKLREDYRVRKGAAFSLKDFHDSFIKLGPLPLPLVRQAMLGERGSLF